MKFAARWMMATVMLASIAVAAPKAPDLTKDLHAAIESCLKIAELNAHLSEVVRRGLVTKDHPTGPPGFNLLPHPSAYVGRNGDVHVLGTAEQRFEFFWCLDVNGWPVKQKG